MKCAANLSATVMMVVFAVTAAMVSPAPAEVIISDTFDSGGNIPGRTPDDTNLTGSTWTKGSQGWAYRSNSVLRIECPGNSYPYVAISIASHDTYVKPTQMTISADILVVNNAWSYTGLGFYSTTLPPDGTPLVGFTGLAIYQNDGKLILYENGTPAANIAYTGTWNAAAFHKLSYTVDLSTGAISDVSFAGSTSDYSYTTTAFTDAATVYAGIPVTTTTRDRNAYIDNFVLTAVPEPATLALLGIGGLLIVSRRR